MKHTPLVAIFITLFGSAFFYSLTDTLDDLTQRDCKAGVVKACEALAQAMRPTTTTQENNND